MLYCLLSSDIKVGRYECSDLNKPLIGLWNLAKNDPTELSDFYRENWPMTKERYNEIRSEFNADQDSKKLFVLTRTCRNGLIRYNQKGAFNSAFHHGRKGMHPDKVDRCVKDWSEKLQPVHFYHRSYEEIQGKSGDLIYLDPPYERSSNFQMYFADAFNFEPFWTWMRKQPCSQLLSLNGLKNDLDCTLDVPKDLFQEHIFVDNGLNTFDQMVNQRVISKDSLYIQMEQK